jgi:hypothetical protein
VTKHKVSAARRKILINENHAGTYRERPSIKTSKEQQINNTELQMVITQLKASTDLNPSNTSSPRSDQFPNPRPLT